MMDTELVITIWEWELEVTIDSSMEASAQCSAAVKKNNSNARNKKQNKNIIMTLFICSLNIFSVRVPSSPKRTYLRWKKLRGRSAMINYGMVYRVLKTHE